MSWGALDKLFGGGVKYSVGSSSSNLYEKNHSETRIKDSILKSLLSGGGHSYHILADYFNSLEYKAKKYAKAEVNNSGSSSVIFPSNLHTVFFQELNAIYPEATASTATFDIALPQAEPQAIEWLKANTAYTAATPYVLIPYDFSHISRETNYTGDVQATLYSATYTTDTNIQIVMQGSVTTDYIPGEVDAYEEYFFTIGGEVLLGEIVNVSFNGYSGTFTEGIDFTSISTLALAIKNSINASITTATATNTSNAVTVLWDTYGDVSGSPSISSDGGLVLNALTLTEGSTFVQEIPSETFLFDTSYDFTGVNIKNIILASGFLETINGGTEDEYKQFTWFYLDVASNDPRFPLTYSTIQNAETIQHAIYPIIGLRLDTVDVATNTGSNDYIAKDAALDKIGLSVQDLTTAYNSEENSNVNELQEVYFSFGVNIADNTQSAIAYLYRFFNEVSFTQLTFSYFTSNGLSDENFSPTTDKINVPIYFFSYVADEYNLHLTYRHKVLTENILGTIGDMGTYSRKLIKDFYFDGFFTEPVNGNDWFNFTLSNSGSKTIQYYQYGTLIIRYQVSETHYNELRLYGLNASADLEVSNGTTDNVSYLIDHDLDFGVDLPDLSADDLSTITQFNIPLFPEYVEELTNKQQGEILYASARLIFYAEQRTYVSWYETGLFKSILIVVAIIIIIFAPWTGQFFAALAEGAIGTAISILGTAILTGYLVAEGIKLAVKELGLDGALVAIAAVAAIAIGGGFVDISSMTLPELALAAVSAIGTAYTADIEYKMNDLLNEQEAFNELYKSEMERFEEITSGFKDGSFSLDNLLDILVEPIIYKNPDEFFAKSLNVNPGQGLVDSIDSYVDSTLNKIHDINYTNSMLNSNNDFKTPIGII